MSFYDPSLESDGFAIDLSETTDLLQRFHRTLMDRRNTPDWESFDRDAYDPDLIESARTQWAQRAVAEYKSTAQFGQLLHRLTLQGAPIELIGAATRLAQDECRHAELCAKMAEVLGGHDDVTVDEGLSLYDEIDDDLLAIYLSILIVCCFGETLSVPILRALYTVSTDPLAESVASIIAGDEEYHARFGWEALTLLTPRLSDAAREDVEARLPRLMSHFEDICHGSPETARRLAGKEFRIEPGDAPNLGTLEADEYAGIMYATMEAEVLPGLAELGYPAVECWQQRPYQTDDSSPGQATR